MTITTMLALVGLMACAPLIIERAYTEASAIFVGRVVSTKSVKTGPGMDEVHTVATLRVQRVWKGPRSTVIEVKTCGGRVSEQVETICTVGANYRVGTSYLVLAFGESLDTSQCATRPLDESIDELLWLASKPSQRIEDR